MFLSSSLNQGFGNIDVNEQSWGAFGNPGFPNPTQNDYANIIRDLESNLAVGHTLSASIAIAFRNGNKGVDIRDSEGNTKVNFRAQNDSYFIGGIDLGWNYEQTSIFDIYANQVTENDAIVKISRRSNPLNDVVITSFNGTVKELKFYVGNTETGNDLNNLFFNSLKVYQTPEQTSTLSPTPTETETPTLDESLWPSVIYGANNGDQSTNLIPFYRKQGTIPNWVGAANTLGNRVYYDNEIDRYEQTYNSQNLTKRITYARFSGEGQTYNWTNTAKLTSQSGDTSLTIAQYPVVGFTFSLSGFPHEESLFSTLTGNWTNVSGASPAGKFTRTPVTLFDKTSFIGVVPEPFLTPLQNAVDRWQTFLELNPNVIKSIRGFDADWNGIKINNYTTINDSQGYIAACGVNTFVWSSGTPTQYCTYDFNLFVNLFYQNAYTQQQWADIMSHELGHALGIGIYWQTFFLQYGSQSPSNDFLPASAYPQLSAAYGTVIGEGRPKVALESSGGSGTQSAHWENNFRSSSAPGSEGFNYPGLQNELMVGFYSTNTNFVISDVSIKTLVGWGYQEKNPGANEGIPNLVNSLLMPANITNTNQTTSLTGDCIFGSCGCNKLSIPAPIAMIDFDTGVVEEVYFDNN